NLFTGPNEAGKSTVVRAIRAAFFDRHGTSLIQDLQPYGELSAAPTVELDFETGGRSYRLRKVFKKKHCELHTGDGAAQPMQGEAAENHLAQLLGFEFAGNRSARTEHQGVPGLLWIEQGTGQDVHAAVGHATGYLRRALDQSAGEVASTRGDDLIARVDKERAALLGKTGKPVGSFAEVIATCEQLMARVADFDLRITRYRQQVDALAQQTAADAVDAKAKPWEAFRARLSEAERELERIRGLKSKLESEQAQAGHFADQHRLVAEKLTGLAEMERQLEQRLAAQQDADKKAETAKQQTTHCDTDLQQAQAEADRASKLVTRAQNAHLRGELQRTQADAAQQIKSLSANLQQAQQEDTQRRDWRKSLASNAVDEAAIKSLRARHAELRDAQIRREAASTRIVFHIEAAGVTLGDEALVGAGERLLGDAVALNIADIGRVQIVPGGAGLAALVQAHAALEAAQHGALQRLGVESLDEAEARFAQRQQADIAIRLAEKALQGLAPHGIARVEEAVAEQTARRDRAAASLDAMPLAADTEAIPLEDALRQFKAAKLQAEARAADAQRSHSALAAATATAESARREHAALEQALQSPEHQQLLIHVKSELVRLNAEAETRKQAIASQREAIAAQRPELFEQDVKRFRASAEEAERLFQQRRQLIATARGQLQGEGALGLEEERAQLGGQLEQANRRQREMKLRADALSLLLELLTHERRELTRRLHAPLQQHVQRYLGVLMPGGAQLDIGDGLAPQALRRSAASGASSIAAFDDLSFGAREQMGVLSRLAYADLLKASGQPTLVILDDALVHSDAERLEQMKRVLFDAAQRHQILLFTCHPEIWRDIGAAPRSIGRPT
ncbi:MAG: hypothetical protein ABJB17_04705, partial [Burkholderiales bacterium]